MDEFEQFEVRISDPGEVAAGLPQLLGFRPVESVVLIGLGGESGGRVGLTVRADIPPPRHAVPLAAAVARGVATDDPAAVLVAVVSEAPDERADLGEPELPHRLLVHAVVVTLAERGIPVRDALLVRRGRWWSYDCPHPCCAPGAGTPLPTGVSELAVASVATGQVVARDRDELVARIEPPVDRGGAPMTAACLQVTTECSARVLELGEDAVVAESWTALAAAVARFEPGAPPPRLTDREVMRIAWGLRDPLVRDRALGLALGPEAARAEILWTECTRRAPVPFDAAPATLLAVSAWLRGDGAMANVALARALASDPGYQLAVLLEGALAGCMPPSELRAMITTTIARLDDAAAADCGALRGARAAATPGPARARPGTRSPSRTRPRHCRE